VDTFVVAIERQQPLPPPAKAAAGRGDALRTLSDLAVRAEREAELAGQAPTLPKRIGLGKDKQIVVPEKLACDGQGFAEVELPPR
jgi:hypothetical protein